MDSDSPGYQATIDWVSPPDMAQEGTVESVSVLHIWRPGYREAPPNDV